MKRLTPRLRAFTLIELLIVITIIGILAVALVPRLTGGPGRARDAQRKADLQQIATALEFYADDSGGNYPASTACVNALDITDYLTTVPSDPSDDGWAGSTCSGDYTYVALSTDGDATDAEGYLLVADLETETERDQGVYDTSFAETTTSSAATNFASAETANDDCFDSACTSTDVVYVIGR